MVHIRTHTLAQFTSELECTRNYCTTITDMNACLYYQLHVFQLEEDIGH